MGDLDFSKLSQSVESNVKITQHALSSGSTEFQPVYDCGCITVTTFCLAIYRRYVKLRSNKLHEVTTNPESRLRLSLADQHI